MLILDILFITVLLWLGIKMERSRRKFNRDMDYNLLQLEVLIEQIKSKNE